MNSISEEQIRNVINGEIKSLISLDGGKIEFVSLENNTIKIRLFGACKYCNARDYTLRNTVHKIIMDTFPDEDFSVILV